jgi:nicotinamidase-related amidase
MGVVSSSWHAVHMASVALVVIDLQRGVNDPSWGPRNNPSCEANIGALLDAWRSEGQPIVYVRHDSIEPGSTLRPGQPGNDLHELLADEPDLLVTKHVSSAFFGEPDLADWLRSREIERVVMCGVQTNMCCESTARVGSNLGFDVRFVLEATHTHDRAAPDGGMIDADTLARVTTANLDPEFCRVVTTAEAIEELRARAPSRA